MIPQFYPVIEQYLLRAMNGDAIPEVEMARPSSVPGGPDRTILVSYQPACDEVGEVIGVSVAIVDITKRKRDEEAVR
jgi:hypothetical protein